MSFLRGAFRSVRAFPVHRRAAFLSVAALGAGLGTVALAAPSEEEEKRTKRKKERRERRRKAKTREDIIAMEAPDASKGTMTSQLHYYQGPVKKKLDHLCLFAGNGNIPLAKDIAKYLGVPLSDAVVSKYADGEIQVQVDVNIRGKDVFIVQPVCSPVNNNLMEMLLLTSCMRRASASFICAVIPYFAYARQDRKMSSRVPISAADVALMLETMGVDRVISVDLHSGQIQGFFAPRIPVDNLQTGLVGAMYFAEQPLRNPVVISPDAGGVQRAKVFREILLQNGHPETDLAMLVEQRVTDEGGHLEIVPKEDRTIDLVGTVKDCDCIIVEDIIDTGFTISRAAEELKRHGAKNVLVFAPHGVFSGDCLSKIEQAPLDSVVVTNTIPLTEDAAKVAKIKQLNIAPLVAETIKRVYEHKSVSSMFDPPKKKKKGAAKVNA